MLHIKCDFKLVIFSCNLIKIISIDYGLGVRKSTSVYQPRSLAITNIFLGANLSICHVKAGNTTIKLKVTILKLKFGASPATLLLLYQPKFWFNSFSEYMFFFIKEDVYLAVTHHNINKLMSFQKIHYSV